MPSRPLGVVPFSGRLAASILLRGTFVPDKVGTFVLLWENDNEQEIIRFSIIRRLIVGTGDKIHM